MGLFHRKKHTENATQIPDESMEEVDGLTPEAAKKPKKKRPASKHCRLTRNCARSDVHFHSLSRHRLQATTAQGMAAYPDTKVRSSDIVDRGPHFCADRRRTDLGQ